MHSCTMLYIPEESAGTKWIRYRGADIEITRDGKKTVITRMCSTDPGMYMRRDFCPGADISRLNKTGIH